MQIELIGCTGAGKSTLLKAILAGCRLKGVAAFSGEEFVLKKFHLNWIKYPLFRIIISDILSITICVFISGKYYKFYDLIIKCVNEIPASEGWLNKINIARNAIKKMAVYEISSRYGNEKYIFIDEGTIHAVHNFFVHASGPSSLKYFNDFIQMVPHPDMLIYLKRDEDILIERTLRRGHKRIPKNSPERVRFFIEQAIAIFRKIEKDPQFSEKLIKISSDGKIDTTIPESNNHSIHFIIKIIQDIYDKKVRNKTEHIA
jgi:deoxyadenosine/deoxycytidine kinase